MKKNMVNTFHVEGILYNHNLVLKESGAKSKVPGTKFISGTIEIATDDEVTNIVPIHFTYVTAVFGKSGSANTTFTVLQNIIDGNFKTYMSDKDNAIKVRVDSAIGLNEFTSNRNGTEEWVMAKRNEGGFVRVASDLEPEANLTPLQRAQRNKFTVDMVINGVSRIEANPDREIAEHVVLKGAIFDFRGALLPVDFVCYDEGGMSYFESLEASASKPVFTQVWGPQVSTTVVRKIVTESAFGAPDVREVPNTRKEYVVTGTSPELPLQDDESTITWAELSKAMADREVYVAAEKTRQANYRAERESASAFNTPTPIPAPNAVPEFKF